MRKWWLRLVLLGSLVALGGLGWFIMVPSPERIIRQRLAELAHSASIAPNEAPLARAFNAQNLAGFFSPDVEITVTVPGGFHQQFRGREELIRTAIAARSSISSLTVEFLDINVTVNPDRVTALAHLTAKANVPGESVPEVQELKVGLEKQGGSWLIRRAETVSTLH